MCMAISIESESHRRWYRYPTGDAGTSEGLIPQDINNKSPASPASNSKVLLKFIIDLASIYYCTLGVYLQSMVPAM